MGIFGNGTVVLFVEEQTGVVVHAADEKHHRIGEVSHHWSENQFERLRGDIILSNDNMS